MSRKIARLEQTSRDMVRWAIRKYSLRTAACVIMWREFYVDWCAADKLTPPDWTRDSADVHRSLKQYLKRIIAIFDSEYGMLAYPVGNKIRKYISHGEPPRRDDSVRTDQWYRECVPSPKNPTMGLVCFPNDTYLDHPLYICQMQRRSSCAASMLNGQVARIQTATVRGFVSEHACNRLMTQVRPSVAAIVEHINKTPLIEGPGGVANE